VLRTLCVDTGPAGDPNPGMVLADLIEPRPERVNPDHQKTDPRPGPEQATNARPALYKPIRLEP
jgi:hypothetical protein